MDHYCKTLKNTLKTDMRDLQKWSKKQSGRTKLIQNIRSAYDGLDKTARVLCDAKEKISEVFASETFTESVKDGDYRLVLIKVRSVMESLSDANVNWNVFEDSYDDFISITEKLSIPRYWTVSFPYPSVEKISVVKLDYPTLNWVFGYWVFLELTDNKLDIVFYFSISLLILWLSTALLFQRERLILALTTDFLY